MAAYLYVLSDLDLAECFIDATFAPAKKAGRLSARPKTARAKIMGIVEAPGPPISILIALAIPHDATLAAATAVACLVEKVLEHLNGNKAYDSYGLDANLAEIENDCVAAPELAATRLGRAGIVIVSSALEDGTIGGVVAELPERDSALQSLSTALS